jgi:hypothetical protein
VTVVCALPAATAGVADAATVAVATGAVDTGVAVGDCARLEAGVSPAASVVVSARAAAGAMDGVGPVASPVAARELDATAAPGALVPAEFAVGETSPSCNRGSGLTFCPGLHATRDGSAVGALVGHP